MSEQDAQWQAQVAASRARGECEFSGLKVTRCVRTICDCFETLEGARAIEAAARATETTS